MSGKGRIAPDADLVGPTSDGFVEETTVAGETVHKGRVQYGG